MNVRGMGLSGGFSPQMNEREARMILNIDSDRELSKALVNSAFVKIISTNHPDRGGSPFIAKKVIEAKEYLTSLSE